MFAIRRHPLQALLRLLGAGMLVCFVALSGAIGAAIAQPLQPVPALTARVIDQTGTLTPQQLQALEDKLAAFESERGSQLVVLMVPTTAPEDIAAYAYHVAAEWKIGRAEVGDGILLVVAKNDRTVRIEVARALEGAVPDLAAFRIIDGLITPAFRQGDFAAGLNAGVDALMTLIRGEELPLPRGGERARQAASWEDLLVLFFAGVPVLGSILSNELGRKIGLPLTSVITGGLLLLVTGSVLLAVIGGVLALVFIVLLGVGGPGGGSGGGGRGGGRSFGGPVIYGGGGGHRGFGSGGFRSGGGGSFGGGGASGRW